MYVVRAKARDEATDIVNTKIWHIVKDNLSEDAGDMAWAGIAMDVWMMKYKLLGYDTT